VVFFRNFRKLSAKNHSSIIDKDVEATLFFAESPHFEAKVLITNIANKGGEILSLQFML